MKIKRLVIAGLLLVSGFSVASAQVKLSFNPEKGTKYEYRQEMLSKVKQNVMGQEVPVDMEISSMYLMEIMDKMPQEIQVQITCKEIAYIISSPMMKMGYDSQSPIENPSDMDHLFGKIISGLLDSPVMMLFSPDGSVKSVTGMDVIADKMTGAIADDGQIAAQIAVQMKQQFSESYMKSSFEQMFKIYPDNPVKTGNNWDMESSVVAANNMNSKVKTKYTLKNINRNMATVAVESDIEMIPAAGTEGNLAGTQTGTIIIDTKTGLPVKGDFSQNIKGTVSMQGMDVQMETVSNINSTIKEVK